MTTLQNDLNNIVQLVNNSANSSSTIIYDEELKEKLQEAYIIIDVLSVESKTVDEKRQLRQTRKYLKSMELRFQGNNNASTSSSNHAVELLRKCNRELLETEKVGQDTLQRLEQQRPVIKRIRENVKETQDSLSFSNRLLTKMSKWWRS